MRPGQTKAQHTKSQNKTKPNKKKLTNQIDEEGASNKNRLFRTSRLFLYKRQRKAMISNGTYVIPVHIGFRRVQIIFLLFVLNTIDIIRGDSHAANQITMHR